MKLDLKKLYLSIKGLTIYRNASKDDCFSSFTRFIEDCVKGEDIYQKTDSYSNFVAILYEKGGNFGKYLNTLLECDDNFYARGCASGAVLTAEMQESLKQELSFLGKLSELTSLDLISSAELPINLARFENTRFDFCSAIPQRLQQAHKYGYGIYAKYGMFRVNFSGKLVPIASPDKIDISSLVGYEYERKQVISNTKALIEGLPAANVLLCGDAGTGKSSTVKAVANMFFESGLRLIELKKEQLNLLPDIMGEIAENPLKFIIFVDDLSFSDNDEGFSSLKAVLEGSASAKAKNTVIYATSNRRHLVKETFSSRQGDDIHRRDTIEELMSLSERFGLTVLYSKPSKELYLQIVKELVKKNLIEIDQKELEIKAEAFALAKGGRSARVAGQFVDSLLTQTED